MTQPTRPYWVPLVATPYGLNSICLELCNTVVRGAAGRGAELLADYGALLGWATRVGAISPEAASALSGLAEREPEQAAASLESAWTDREHLYQVFSARAAGREVSRPSLAALNRRLADVLGRWRVGPEGTGFWEGAGTDLGSPVWSCLLAGAELLGAPLVERVRECASDDCGWMFLDLSPNRKRRWCDMQSCGNRAKARRFQDRHRARDL